MICHDAGQTPALGELTPETALSRKLKNALRVYSMTWLAFAFSAPVLWALSTHMDKYLVDRYFRSSDVAVLLVFTAFIGLLTLPLIWWFSPQPITSTPQGASLTAFAGALYMAGMLFYLRALQSEDVDNVAPFFQASPLFSYVLGYLVLGETLSPIEILGGVLIVGGAVAASVQIGQRKQLFKARLAGLMLLCAFLLAVSSLIFKIFALRAEFWPTTFWMYAGEAFFGATLLVVPSHRTELAALLRVSPGAVLSVNAINELVNLAGTLGGRYALMLAPLSLVQAISSTSTLFVFAFGIFLSAICPSLGHEDLSRGNIALKAIAAVAVSIGAFIIAR